MMERHTQTNPCQELPGQETTDTLHPPLPPQQQETETDSKPLGGAQQPPQGIPDDASATVGQDVTSVGQTNEADAEAAPPTEVSASMGGDKQDEAEEPNMQEEAEIVEGEENGPHQLPHSNPDGASATVGQDVTSVGQINEADTEAAMHTEEAELMNKEAEEPNEQEEADVGEGEEDGPVVEQNHVQNSPAPSSRRSSRSKCPMVSKYNTVCYRKIKKGNTRQRIDEFESMMSI